MKETSTGARIGTNRTGIDMSPIDSKQMIAGAEAENTAVRSDTGAGLAASRSQYIRDAEPVGSIPAPGTLRGVASTGAQKLTGKHPEVLLDKLGERLAFERTGTRLYDALITKCETAGVKSGIVPLETLRKFRQEEAKHFEMVRDAMRSLGADPTAQTPSADINAVASMGVLQVMTDPRSTVPQSLQAILIAELADNDGWNLLIQLTDEMGLKPMAEGFRVAQMEEAIHLETVRKWLKQMTFNEAKVA